MTDLLLGLIDRASPWLLNVSATIVLVALAAGLSVGVWRYYAVGRRDDRYSRVMEKYSGLSEWYRELYEGFKGVNERFRQLSTTLRKCCLALSDFITMAPGRDARLGVILGLRQIAEAVREDVKLFAGEVHRSAIWTRGEGPWLAVTASSGFGDDKLHTRTLPVDDSIAGSVFRTGKARLTANALAEPDYKRLEESVKYRSLMCVPIKSSGGAAIGVLTVDGQKEDSFDSQDLLVAELYAGLAGLYLGSLPRGGAAGGSGDGLEAEAT